MKCDERLEILQATAWYPPFGTGGTEVYVEGLVAELGRLAIGTTVLVPRQLGAAEVYTHRGARVETFPVNETPYPGELKSQSPHIGFEDFRCLLAGRHGAIYHQHAWTRGCGLPHLKAARELGMRTVLTAHVPGNVCLRGTMLRFGETPCDGRVASQLCGACWAENRGLSKGLAKAVGQLPLGVARFAHAAHGRLATALSARNLAVRMLRQIEEMIANADRIVAVCQWLYDALALNGVPHDKLVLSRQGVSNDFLQEVSAVRRTRRHRPGPLRLLLLARWDPVKGVDTAVRAVHALPAETQVELRVHGVPVAGAEEYEKRVRQLAEGDARIRIDGPLPHDRIGEALAEADVLLVPSNWLETGPLTVLEAQAAGLFVLGSRRGGIAELVDEDDAGELVEAGNVEAWAAAIGRLAARHSRAGPPTPSRPVRTMADAAADMAELYRSL
jgi:glycosyltransferase involved in cell wall biosynthesis